MPDYIDREALFHDIFGSVVFSVRNEHSVEVRGATKIMERIKCAPAADVAPVVHGRWGRATDGVVCSACDEYFYALLFDHKKFQYCPHCGAKMDLE